MLTVALALLAGCGFDDEETARSSAAASSAELWQFPNREIPGVEERTVGEGERGVALLWPAGQEPPGDTIVFFHGWEPLPPFLYGAWLRHLVAGGNTVIFPAYKAPDTRPSEFRANAIAGITAAFEEFDANPDSVIAIGHTIGGALAFDYAAVARERGVPAPRAVFAVYPGRGPPGERIPSPDLSRIPPAVWLMAAGGPGNRLPNGDAEVRTLLRAATRVPPERRKFYRAPPFSPIGLVAHEPTARQQRFWHAVDRFIIRARVPSVPAEARR